MASPLRTRLGKLAPALSAKERFLLVLKARNAGEPEDPALRRTMPRNQVKAFNRYAHLAYIANATLGVVLQALRINLESLELALPRIALLDKAAEELEEAHPETKQPAQTPGHITIPAFLRELARQQRRDLRQELSLRRRELRALEVVWAEIAAEFGGEPVTDPSLRKLTQETKERLDAIGEGLSPPGGRYRVPTPNPAFVDELRQVVRDAYDRLGWVEAEEPKGRTAHGR